MINKVYEITDEIEKSNLNKRLTQIKQGIKNNEDLKRIINNFNKAKKLYEQYNYKDDFIKAKTALMQNEILKEYIDIQNKINMLTIKINARIKQIISGVKQDNQ